jgi:murein L,D-transpeptidase YcbB/YkuD
MTPRHTPRAIRRAAAAGALIAALLLAACQQQAAPPGAVGGSDVQYALKVLAAAPSQGFAPGSFGEQRVAQLWTSKGPPDPSRDRRLHDALIAYAKAEHGLRIPARAFLPDWGLKPAPYDAERSLRQAVKAGRFRQWLDSQPPPSPRYRALVDGYARYLKVSAAGGWPMLTSATGLRPGANGPQVRALRQRLAFEDSQVGADTPAFDAALAGAVARFQAAHGLPPTGAVDAQTLQALNVPAQARAAQIRANLERLRWLPREEPPTRVEVNSAAATFDYFADGKPAMHMLAAAGKPGDETPILISAIDSIVLNPPWNVPDSIAQAELLPKEAASPGYLEAHGFTTSGDGQGTRLVQQPGPQSALGLVKFNFPNSYSVYLHDTPSKAAFDRSQRSVSHGCVRLEHAMAFAKLLLSAEPGWSADRVDQVIASGQTTEVKLGRRAPVRLLYLTAYPEGGGIAFRPDVYGWDEKVLQLLDAPPREGQVAQTRAPVRG